MKDIQVGTEHTSFLKVENQHLACNVGSGDLQVLATPMMIALMENAAMNCVAPYLDTTETTVGSQINASHIRPTGVGKTITATARLQNIEGRKLTFAISASDEQGLIGEGEHIRFVILRDKFMNKI